VRAIEAAVLRDEHRCITTSPVSAPNSTVTAACTASGEQDAQLSAGGACLRLDTGRVAS
jgi:hypothetical protein